MSFDGSVSRSSFASSIWRRGPSLVVALAAGLFLLYSPPADADTIVSTTATANNILLSDLGTVGYFTFNAYNPGAGFTVSSITATIHSSGSGSVPYLGVVGSTHSFTLTDNIQLSPTLFTFTAATYALTSSGSCKITSGFLGVGGCTATASWNDTFPTSSSLNSYLGLSTSQFTIYWADFATASNGVLGSFGNFDMSINYDVVGTGNPGGVPGGTGGSTQVPEPASLALLGTGLAALFLFGRWKSKKIAT